MGPHCPLAEYQSTYTDLSARRYADVQVAKHMLEVLIFHGLAQERQGATGFPAAVPDLSARAQLGGLAPARTLTACPVLYPDITLMGMTRRFSRKDWKRKVRG